MTANAHRMAGRRRLNLRIDPPPDLAIEVDVTSSSLDRLAIYSALRVPELWRVESDEVNFYVLQRNGKYVTAGKSKSFPLLTPEDLLNFLQQAREAVDQNVVTRRFRTWIRRQQR